MNGYKTMMGYSIDELQARLDEELPADAYKQVPSASYLTDIDPAQMRRVLTEVFGLCGVGWGYRYDPETVAQRVFEFTTSKGASKTRYEATVTGLVFWYRLVNDGLDGMTITCEIPATGGSENTTAAFALKGALTNAIGNAVSNLGFQESVYLGQRSHQTVGNGGNGHRPASGNGGTGSDAGAVEVKFGKHAGKTLRQIAAEDADYLEWLAENWKWEQGRKAAAAVLAHCKQAATS
ncbi:MAG: hypothetical protein JXD18_14980 [Anaerolineae bacterium]|nr:hypothetical protein [Anaerolineae bacterium]